MFYTTIRLIIKIWFTGLLALLAIPGYLFYGILWAVRLMQSNKVLLKFVGTTSVLTIFVSVSLVIYFLFPFGSTKSTVDLIIPQNGSIRSIVDSLYQKKVIRSSNAMLLWLKITKNDRKIQAGKVTFYTYDGVIRATEKLLDAVALEVTLKITEGHTFEQIAGMVQEQIGVDSLDFVRKCVDTNFIRTLDIEATTLEGYLFPETYRLPQNTTAEQVITRMVQQFNKAYERIEKDSLIVSLYSRHQIVTLASIVEKEATLAEERTRISGVFHNRLKKNYRLGADPTVRYIFRKFSGPLRVSELNSNSPYNTRKVVGLPPGPICSPGFLALQAAASPLKTDELYFVAKWDGSGAHDFSRTNAEHDRKKLKIRRENDRRNKNK